ncbi:hypothetical protein PCL_03822 [Purpureocillium lilacinum]|uniref:Uncharacterized protein n=1 Tax=Purpureocillium lilacinum TaxID=33203 RepID=A0A2U3EQ53_PURLI|nr:hypothetical protein PCL_03822 [Purpureocillium lilacinum]
MGSSRRPARPHETGDKLDRLAHTSTQISTEPWNRRWAPPKPPYAMMPGLRDRYFSRQVRALAIGSVPSSAWHLLSGLPTAVVGLGLALASDDPPPGRRSPRPLRTKKAAVGERAVGGSQLITRSTAGADDEHACVVCIQAQLTRLAGERSGILTAGAVRLPLCLSGPCRHSPFADKMSDGAGPDGPRTRKPMEYNQTDLAAFGAVQLGTWRSDEWLSCTAGALLALSTRADLLPSNRAEADGIRRHLANWCRLI